MTDWLSELDSMELQIMAPQLFVMEEPEDAALYLYREGLTSPIGGLIDEEVYKQRAKLELESRPPKKYWEYLKQEVHILICTDNPKYEDLRKKLIDVHGDGTKYIVGLVTGAIGVALGIEAGALTAMCAVILHAAVKIGKEAYCAMPIDV